MNKGILRTSFQLIGAWSYGIGSCGVTKYNKHYASNVRLILDVPEDYQLIPLVSLGYPADKILITLAKNL